MDNLTFLDFFAGIGGMRSGLELAGHKCIGFCEKDKYAILAYNAIYNTDGEWFENDITKIKTDTIPKADIWTGGFPCQGYTEEIKIPKFCTTLDEHKDLTKNFGII